MPRILFSGNCFQDGGEEAEDEDALAETYLQFRSFYTDRFTRGGDNPPPGKLKVYFAFK